MKPTITSLSKHICKSRQALYDIKKKNPVYFEIIWMGWIEYCKEKGT
jgi:hypothetical protein